MIVVSIPGATNPTSLFENHGLDDLRSTRGYDMGQLLGGVGD